MIETPRLTTTAAQPIAYIELKATWDNIQSVMHDGLDELRSVLQAQGIAQTGPWFTHHFRRPEASFHYEMCFPVSTPVRPVGRVQRGTTPSLRVVRTIYHGGYDQLGEGWGEFCEWIGRSGLSVRDDLYEAYLVGMETGDDASKYRTELTCPLKP